MDINDLDFENVGSWPALYRGVFIALAGALFAGAFYYYVTIPQLEQLKVVEDKEHTLKENFKVKAALSANLEAYRAQMVEINIIFEGLINKLPSTKEIASLLDDISFIGGDNGLQFKSINWGAKKDVGLSVEVPISIQVVGTYDQLGSFAADIAALPRIVILDNLRLSKGSKELLTLNVIAKTYRYKNKKAKKKKGKK
ncbi:pilus assembly protein PilP [Psychromonas sp. psych-6C06]|uniref:type 4a pilus biogenesis protein PilO n=1 Tax=Psychromonas sp. psych-6C06 TaxID=2058089 RepID=UPI000C343032|nr:type 4a pilus biogenesis protein PilO [Psychromonas sp. psych-6C06]PKF61481.1 pilus assembly protein PilP [Psychromonas sp. psych-6C06]